VEPHPYSTFIRFFWTQGRLGGIRGRRQELGGSDHKSQRLLIRAFSRWTGQNKDRPELKV
jgi:hypothetical protein